MSRSPSADAAFPTGVDFDWSTLRRVGVRGDNWCMTHAEDGHLYTMMDDGHGFEPTDDPQWNSRLFRITGGPDFDPADTAPCPGWPFHPAAGKGRGFYGYGTVAVGRRIYTWVWLSERPGYNRPIANRLVYTDDFGETFYRWDGVRLDEATFADTDPSTFVFHREQPEPKAGRDAYAFIWIACVQRGQANAADDDGFVYLYAVEQRDVCRPSLIRVPADRLCNRDCYEYLAAVDAAGNAAWTADPAERGPAIVYPEADQHGNPWIWCSWHPSVVYNPGLGRYVMASYGISDPGADYWSGWCKPTSPYAATFGLWHAPNPWGPWTSFYLQPDWKTPDDVPPGLGFDGRASRTYQFKLNPKWTSADGRTMWLHWSDAGGEWDTRHGHHEHWYRWNQVKLEIETGE